MSIITGPYYLFSTDPSFYSSCSSTVDGEPSEFETSPSVAKPTLDMRFTAIFIALAALPSVAFSRPLGHGNYEAEL
jgi:hypothetical protein